MSHRYFYICTFACNYFIENHFNTRFILLKRSQKYLAYLLFIFGSCFEIFKGHLKNTVCAKLLIMLCAPIASNSNGKGCVHVTTLGMEVYVRVYLPLFQCMYINSNQAQSFKLSLLCTQICLRTLSNATKLVHGKKRCALFTLDIRVPFLPPLTPLFECSSSLFYSLLYIYLSNELK